MSPCKYFSTRARQGRHLPFPFRGTGVTAGSGPILILAVALLFLGMTAGTARAEWATVWRVLSGDTIEISGYKRVRLMGVEAPSLKSRLLHQHGLAHEAMGFLRGLIEGKRVRLERLRAIPDDPKTEYRFVYTEKGRLVQELLLEKGYAQAVSYPSGFRMEYLNMRFGRAARMN